jgi:hypothetical protein
VYLHETVRCAQLVLWNDERCDGPEGGGQKAVEQAQRGYCHVGSQPVNHRYVTSINTSKLEKEEIKITTEPYHYGPLKRKAKEFLTAQSCLGASIPVVHKNQFWMMAI